MLQFHVLGTGLLEGERQPASAQQRERPSSEPAQTPTSSDGAAAPASDFARVYEDHFAFAWRSLRLLGVAEDVLEDATQDVFEVVSRQLAEFSGRSTLRTWIFSIVQRTAANHRRRHRRKVQQLVPLRDAIVASEPSPHAHAEALDAAQRIERYAATLAPDRRALFVLVLLEEVPAPEAARALGLPLNTVYSRIRALRAGLLRALGGGEARDD